jgi:hypothetical protein
MAVNAMAIQKTSPSSHKIYNSYITEDKTHIFVFVKKTSEKNLLMYINPKTIGKIQLLTPNGEVSISYKHSAGTGIVITLPQILPFNSLSVLKIEKIAISNSPKGILD